MNRRYKRRTNTSKIKETIIYHFESNLKEYIIITLIFFIGILVGVMFVNKASEIQKTEIVTYITSFIMETKEKNSIDEMSLLINSIKKNLVICIFLWFMGSTIIGIFIVYLTICFRGFCLGYTISSIILSLRYWKRNFTTVFNNLFPKYIIYTLYNFACSKWNTYA